MIKFCVKPGCRDVAIGVARWDRNLRSHTDHCRKHYLSDVLTDTMVCEVVGPCLITDVRTQQGVAKGGRVELDPAEVNIPQLVYAGHVRLVDPEPAAKPVAAKPKD